MTSLTHQAFDLPDHLAAKADPALIAADEEHFARIAQSLEETIADLSDRLDAERKNPGGAGQEAMDRDNEVHRLTARLRALRRFTLDLCLGRIVAEGPVDTAEPTYIGRLGLTDRAGRRLLVDWRSPAAEPFFGATHGNPMGLASRRRYRWTRGRVNDYWDEVFTPDGLEGHAALDDQSAFIASLGSSRSARMRDVLSTIQADQDAIVRAGSRGALVVDGGPGTGKTVVALHRTAYLLYADPRLGHRRGGVLFVGPHQAYLAYVADVLPSLGEDGVQTCTVRDLVSEGSTAVAEADPEVARLKSSADMVRAIEPAVRLYEEPPTEGVLVETAWSDIWLSADEWAEAFASPDPGTPHNEAREQVWDELLSILVDKHDDDEVPADQVRGRWRGTPSCAPHLTRAWPLLEAADVVGDLWSVPAYLRHVRSLADPGRGPAAAQGGPARLDGVRPAAPRRGPAAARRPRGVPPPAPPRRGRRGPAGTDGRGRGRADHQRRLRDARDVDAARRRPAREVGRRGRPAERRPRPARRTVRAHRGRRGPGADRRGVADAAAPLPVAQPHHRGRPRPGPARVHGVLAGTARASRAGAGLAGVPEHQLPHARRR